MAKVTRALFAILTVCFYLLSATRQSTRAIFTSGSGYGISFSDAVRFTVNGSLRQFPKVTNTMPNFQTPSRLRNVSQKATSCVLKINRSQAGNLIIVAGIALLSDCLRLVFILFLNFFDSNYETQIQASI